MAVETFTFNIAKGRVAEFVHRVKVNDPANSALILVPLSVGGSKAQGEDFATLAAVLADVAFDEQTAGGWTRKTLTDAQIADIAADNTGNLMAAAIPSVTFTAPTAGNNVVQLLVCYDADTTSGTDTDIIPLTAHVFAVTADGNDVVINAGTFFQAS